MNRQKTKRLGIKGLAVASVCCVIITAVAGIAVLCYFFAPKRVDAVTRTVPDLLGKSANGIQMPRGFVVKEQYEYSDDVEAGKIISQNPAPESRRKAPAGEHVVIEVTVSLGKKTNRLPDVSGMPYVAAAIKLREIGADVLSVSVYGGSGQSGIVISSDPPADTEIQAGERVTIYVSRDRKAASVRVPSLVGMNVEDACATLMSLGLKLGELAYDEESNAPHGAVTFQSLAPDMHVKGGTHIDLTVSGAAETHEEQTEEKEQSRVPWWHFW